VGAATVEMKIKVSDAVKLVAEEPVCTVRRQRTDVLEASYHIGHRAGSRTSQIRDEVSYLLLASVVRESFPICQSVYLPMEFTDMFDPSNDVCRADRAIHRQGFSYDDSTGSCKIAERQ
jgi:hypothetical protein